MTDDESLQLSPSRPAVDCSAHLQVHVGYRPHADDIDYNQLSFETQSFSGAKLANLVNSAAYVAAREDRDTICMNDFLRVRVPCAPADGEGRCHKCTCLLHKVLSLAPLVR